jgi:hypothetical protein
LVDDSAYSLFFVVIQKKKLLIEVFLGKSLVSRLLDPLALKRVKIDNVLTISAVFFLILALSQPRWGYYWKDLEQKGVDIIIALDVSSSMLAQDIKPNRLERAKTQDSGFIKYA